MTAAPSDYELLTEHFSYPPVSLLDDIINAVNTLADRALESVERLLLSIPPQKLGFSKKKSSSRSSKTPPASSPNADLPPEEAAHLEIENGTHQLETLLNASIDKTFDVFELYVMQNILNVRAQDQPFMRLSHYAGLDLQHHEREREEEREGQEGQEGQHLRTEAQDRPTPESITGLRRRLQASQKLNAVLEAERARNDILLANLRGLLGAAHSPNGGIPEGVRTHEAARTSTSTSTNTNTNTNTRTSAELDVRSEAVTANAGAEGTSAPFAFLRDRAGLGGGGAQPITTTTEFTLSQLQALRALSKSLRGLLPDLAAEATGGERDSGAEAETQGPKSSWRRERAEYIESSSRKYLETVGGLELSAAGEVRDGDWQGQGRGLSKGDVEGLERIVALFGTGDGGEDGDETPFPTEGEAMDEG